MKTMILGIQRFLKDEEGVTALEYGLLAALIAVIIIAGAALLGTNINNTFCGIANCIQTPAAGCFVAAPC